MANAQSFVSLFVGIGFLFSFFLPKLDAAEGAKRTELIRGRKHCIPVLYTSGTFYEVGESIGSTFRGIIGDYVENSSTLKEALKFYNTSEGRKIYEKILQTTRNVYPQYLREIEGIANGAGVSFLKIFLLHISSMIPHEETASNTKEEFASESLSNAAGAPFGCSSVSCNQEGQEILGHTEDAEGEFLGHFYVVYAHIKEDGFEEEHFMSLCYASYIAGYTMGNNTNGLVYSINTIHVKRPYLDGLPIYFVTRALLGAKSISDLKRVLELDGVGSGEAVSVNFVFVDDAAGISDDDDVEANEKVGILNVEKGSRVFYNVEVAPPLANGDKKSLLSFKGVKKGEPTMLHCNKYLRLNSTVQEDENGLYRPSSFSRHVAFEKWGKNPTTREEVETLLSYTDENDMAFFRDWKPDEAQTQKMEPGIATIAVGIFDCTLRKWFLYADRPTENKPAIPPIDFIPLKKKSNE